jgi:dihydrofolate reductase
VPGIICFDSVTKALQHSINEKQEEVFIIGGGEIYREILPMAGTIYYTRVHASPEGDTRFPELNWNEWKVLSKEMFVKDDRNDFDFDILELKKISG